MATFTNGEAGSSVRTKINASITKTDNLTVTQAVNLDTMETKLATIENNADVTDAANVDAAGAVMNSDTSTAAMSFVVDEDNMISNSETKVPTQQSVKAYVDAAGVGGYTDEQVRDVIAAALVAGTNITITPNDGADTITIAASGSGSGDMAAATYDAAGIAEQLVGLTAAQTLTNKTLTQPTLSLKQGTGVTTEGVVEWNATDNKLLIGAGGVMHTFLASAHFSGDATVSTAGVVTLAAGAVDIAHLSAAGTPSSSTFLRGDNTWAAGGGSIAWSDPVDANIVPDADGTRNIGATATRFAAGYFDSLDTAALIVNGGEVTAAADPAADSVFLYDHGGTAEGEWGGLGSSLQISGSVLNLTEAARTKEIAVSVFDTDDSVATGDGLQMIPIPSSLNGMNIVSVRAFVYTQGVTGSTDVQVRRRRAGANVDVLSTKVTVGAEYHAADGVINTSNDDLATGDVLLIDVDAVHTTPPLGLSVAIRCRLP